MIKNVPEFVRKTLKGVKVYEPYIYQCVSEYSIDYAGDTVNWCQNQLINDYVCKDSAVLIHVNGKRFIKIVDPICFELEQLGILPK